MQQTWSLATAAQSKYHPSSAIPSFWYAPISEVPGIGTERARLLEKLGVFTGGDLLLRKPRRYEDRRTAASQIEPGAVCTLQVRIQSFQLLRLKRNPITIFEAEAYNLGPRNERLKLRWFNAAYMEKIWQDRSPQAISVFGKTKVGRNGQLLMDSPEWEQLYDDAESHVHTQRIVPIYSLTEGLTQRTIRRIIWNLLKKLEHSATDDWLPLVTEYGSWRESLRQLHFPESFAAAEKARKRLAFDEFFVWQTLLCLRRRKRIQEKTHPIPPSTRFVQQALQNSNITLTQAQQRCYNEISADLGRTIPMNRLLQGDVGSGKTWVALLAMLQVAEAGKISALMAPTEILAQQHYNNVRKIAGPLGLTVGLLTSKIKTKSGDFFQPHIWVGTHALFQQKTQLPELSLVVIDEQHKFGVEQRAALRLKGKSPHTLVMTATPIPRTLALTLYGDLDLSLIDEMPQGRGKLCTYIRDATALPKIWEFVKKQCLAGRQAYVVYPIIGPNEATEDLKSLEQQAETLKKIFSPLAVEILHGRLSLQEKDGIMRRFRENKTAVLVATTVIEVGVDVPNANVMVVENAERFGLAQLHQLRGRIGRGIHDSYCILVLGKSSEHTRQRLSILEQTRDGFRIAEADLEQRGLGDLLGLRQSGLEPFRIGNISSDLDIIHEARRQADALLEQNPTLAGEDFIELRRRVRSLARYLKTHLVDRA